MKVIVCGGRNFYDAEMVAKYLDMLLVIYRFDTVIHGAARGADTLAGVWARRNHLDEEPHHADWDRLGRKAGVIRNAEMLKSRPQLVIAFPGNRGTRNMMDQATANGVNVINLRLETVRRLVEAQYRTIIDGDVRGTLRGAR